MRRLSLAALASVAIVSQTHATNWIVDASGGGQFTDIPPALAVAQPGDSLLVLAGTYSGFTLDKGVFVIGYGTVVTGPVIVDNVPAGLPAAAVHLALPNVHVSSCTGTVILQELTHVESLDVDDSPDVRVLKCSIARPNGPMATYATSISNSRLELAESTVSGSFAPACLVNGNGGPACSFTSSRVHMARSSAYGGNGASCSSSGFQCGNGANAIDMSGELILAGGGASDVSAGAGGVNLFYDDCTHDGDGAIAVAGMGDVHYSGANVVSGNFILNRLHCTYDQLPQFAIGQPAIHVTPDDPTLDVKGDPFIGQSIKFTVYGAPTASAILYFGRHPIVVPALDPGTIEQLTPKGRVVNLGFIPASGYVQFVWPIAANVPQGTLLIAQAEVTPPASNTQRTNSIPVIVR